MSCLLGYSFAHLMIYSIQSRLRANHQTMSLVRNRVSLKLLIFVHLFSPSLFNLYFEK